MSVEPVSGLERCPATGFSILTRPEWFYKGDQGGFSVQVSLIGEHILYVRAGGFTHTKDQIQSLALQKQVANQYIKPDVPFIQIHDWKDLNGATKNARQLFIGQAKSDSRLLGLYFCNTSFLFRMSIKLGKRLNRVPFPIQIADTYEQAVYLAKKQLRKKGLLVHHSNGMNPFTTPEVPELLTEDCRITGFKITRPPQWQDLKLDDGYHAAFQLIGDHIVHVNLSGKITGKGTRRLVRLHDKFIQKMDLMGKPYAEIRCGSKLTGLPPEQSRSRLVKFIQERMESGCLTGFWLYAIPDGLKSVYRTGLKLHDLELTVGVVDSYKEAIIDAVSALKKKHIQLDSAMFETSRFTKDDWVMEKDGYQVVFEVINNNILYSAPSGILKNDYIKDLFKLYLKVIKEAGFDDGKRYYRILNWENFKRNQWRAGKEYVRNVRKINKLFPSSLSVVYGMNRFTSLMLNISRPFIPFEVVTGKNLEHAIEIISQDDAYLTKMRRENKSQQYDRAFNLQIETYKDQLLKFMGALEWDQIGIKDDQIPESHPLKEIFNAVSIIKSDLDALFEERNKAESLLRRDEEKYRNILENMDDGYYEVDLNGNFLFFNETLLKLLGYTKARFSSMNYKQIIDKKTADSLFKAFEQVYRTGIPQTDFGYEMISRDHKKLYGETSISLMHDEDGKVIGFRGVVRDRTEKKALEDEVARHQKSLEKLIRLRTRELEEETVQKNYVKKINTCLFNISDAVNTSRNLEELYPLIHQFLSDIIEMPNFYIGIYHPQKDLIVVPYHEDQHDVDFSQILQISKRNSLSSLVVLDQKPLFLKEADLALSAKNHQMVGHLPKNWLGVPLISQEKTIGIMATQSYTDQDHFSQKDLEVLISVSNQIALAIERRQALDDLHEREEKYRKLIETTSAGYWQVDENDLTVDVNQALCDMIGYCGEEIIGRSPYDFFQEGRKERYDELLDQSRLILDRNYETTFIRKSGELLHAKVDATSIFDDEGEFQGSFAFITDITERREAEKKLIKETKRANQMARAAKAASKAKSEFLANMSHEIRTPINGVIGMAEIILDSPLDETQKNYVRTIGSEADSLLDIINTILDFSKIEAGKMELEKIGFDLGKMFDDLYNLMHIQADQKGIGFTLFLDSKIPTRLMGDPGRLRQIFTNLIGNSLKFTPKGEISVKGLLIGQTRETVSIRFEVIDTGIGIKNEHLAHIFNSFSQADGSTTRKYGGTGLGTTISKQLVELMNGKIGVDSKENQGATFWFEITLEKDLSGLKNESFPVSPDLSAVSPDLSGVRVFLVEPREKDRMIINDHLIFFGCRTFEAKTLDQAMTFFRQNTEKDRIDTILVDFNLAETNGFKFAKAVQQLDRKKQIPIILITSMGNIGDAKRCREAGINGYLTKPIKKADLEFTIRSVLNMTAEEQSEISPLVTRHSIQEPLKKHCRILVVEDYPTNQQIALKHLNQAGFKAVLAENGTQAVRQFENARFDLILMDIQMPEMDGYQATEQIRKIEKKQPDKFKQNQRTPIIAMTAHAMKGYKKKCLEAGMDDYLAKPLKRNDLISMVNHWLGRPITDKGDPDIFLKKGPSSSAPLQIDQALEEFGQDQDFLGEVMGQFINNVKKQLTGLHAAVDENDFLLIEQQAHAIKGGAANLTAARLSQKAHALEMAGKQKNAALAADLLDRVEQAFKDLCRFLESEHPMLWP